MAQTELQIKKESIKKNARLNKFSVWYMDTQQKEAFAQSDQVNGELFTGVENAIIKYYSERTNLNGQTVSKLMGTWGPLTSLSSTSPWMLSMTAPDYDTFPTITAGYLDMNIYKLCEQMYKNQQSGSGTSGMIGLINNLATYSDWLLNGWIFAEASGSTRYGAAGGSTVTLKVNPEWPPGQAYLGVIPSIPGASGPPIPWGRYYIEANGVKGLYDLTPAMLWSPVYLSYGYQGWYRVNAVFYEEGGSWSPDWAGGPHAAVIQNYYEWTNNQRVNNGDWWSNQASVGWQEFPGALTTYYNGMTSLITRINALVPILADIIAYYKSDITLLGETTPVWEVLGGTGTWDNPGDIALGWTEIVAFHTEVTTGGGGGSWASQLTAHLPASPTSHGAGYSDAEIGAVNTIANDFKTKINSRTSEINGNNVLGTLAPETKDGAFGGLRALRYLWTDSRLNKSGGSLVQHNATIQGVTILTGKANLLDQQLDALRIPADEREPRTEEVDCSRMEFIDRIRVSWKMVMQTAEYEIHRFDAGTGDAGRLYNTPDGPADNLFSLVDTINAVDGDGLPVTRYDDMDLALTVGHYYYYKIKIINDGTGFPPPYDANDESTSGQPTSESYMSLNFYDSKVWRAIVEGSLVITDGFINSGAIKSS